MRRIPAESDPHLSDHREAMSEVIAGSITRGDSSLVRTDYHLSVCIICQEKPAEGTMRDFPDFMKNEKNRVSQGAQNTEDIEGYFYEGAGGGQMAFWTCNSERESKKHKHDFDEYIVIVSGQYTACLEDREIVLNPGDELFVPAGTVQWGRCIAGTRSIHAFGGKRIQTE